jgi:hypothetical protein
VFACGAVACTYGGALKSRALPVIHEVLKGCEGVLCSVALQFYAAAVVV